MAVKEARVDVETIGDEDKSAGIGVQVIARAASVAGPRRKARRTEPGANRPGSWAGALDRAARCRCARSRDFVSEAQPGRGVRIGAGVAGIAASISSGLTDIFILISSPCATGIVYDQTSQFCREVPRCSSIELRDSSASSPSRA